MEHDDNPLPISIGTLSELASKCHAFAKVYRIIQSDNVLDVCVLGPALQGVRI